MIFSVSWIKNAPGRQAQGLNEVLDLFSKDYRFESYKSQGYWRFIWLLTSGPVRLIKVYTSWLIKKKKGLNVYCRIILTSSCLIEVAVSPGCLEHAYYPKSEYCFFTKLKNIFNTLTPPVCLSWHGSWWRWTLVEIPPEGSLCLH
jgi:hypothetical protein